MRQTTLMKTRFQFSHRRNSLRYWFKYTISLHVQSSKTTNVATFKLRKHHCYSFLPFVGGPVWTRRIFEEYTFVQDFILVIFSSVLRVCLYLKARDYWRSMTCDRSHLEEHVLYGDYNIKRQVMRWSWALNASLRVQNKLFKVLVRDDIRTFLKSEPVNTPTFVKSE